jgi:2-succinyl-5-enolpyruvyl-6-hydroxy-3-cyclohexene-1-carboxylate synthase
VNPSTALARVLLDELARCGVRDVVLAPGSRSAPLAIAAQALDAAGRIRLHVRVDERSAGFLALGLAKVSGAPAALLCTSGTAAANFHPAVLEAHQAHVPLLVLTADRPPELRGTGANQTIDQIRLYGAAVRLFAEVGAPDRAPGLVTYWRSLAARAAAAAIGGGPVHLNVAFREPLVPDGVDDWPEPLDGRPDGAPWTLVERPPLPARRLEGPVERGAVLVGDGAVDPAAAVALAEAAGWPLLSEPTGGARRGPNALTAYSLLIADRDFAGAHAPDLVVTVGKPGLSRPLLAWLRTARRHVVVDPHGDWADPTRTADLVLAAVPTVAPAQPAESWLSSWLDADAAAVKAVAETLESDPVLSEPRLARDLMEALPDGALLVAGSSRPVRDLDAFARPRNGVRVIGNRGTSGIDGLVSTAIGAALAHAGPSYALMGDLAYLHDRNGLVLGPDEPRPDLTFVVVDNDGGGIFSLLPQAGVAGFERVFGTPHGVDIAADAAAVGVAFADVRTPAELEAALAPGRGLRVVRVRTDRAATAALHGRLRDAVAATLSTLSTLSRG